MFSTVSRVLPTARLLSRSKPSSGNLRSAVNHSHSLIENAFNRQDVVEALQQRLIKALGPDWKKRHKGRMEIVSNKILDAVFLALTDLLARLELVKGSKENLRKTRFVGKKPRGTIFIKNIATIEKAPNERTFRHPRTGKLCPPRRPGCLNVSFADEIIERAFPGWKSPAREKAKLQRQTILGS